MQYQSALKALADDNRLKIVTLLLSKRYCVKALAKNLNISEAAVSQHLKVLKDTQLVIGEKKGYYMHYTVDRTVLKGLGSEISALADIEQIACTNHDSDSHKCTCHCKKEHDNE